MNTKKISTKKIFPFGDVIINENVNKKCIIDGKDDHLPCQNCDTNTNTRDLKMSKLKTDFTKYLWLCEECRVEDY